jgi:hypothetical protein
LGQQYEQTPLFMNLQTKKGSVTERLIFVTIAHIFHRFDLSFDGMNEETGEVDGLLRLFPPKSFRGLTVGMRKEYTI